MSLGIQLSHRNILSSFLMIQNKMKNRKIERCNNKSSKLRYMNKKGLCKNCGEDINDDNNSNDFCSEQCGVEYQMEHNRK